MILEDATAPTSVLNLLQVLALEKQTATSMTPFVTPDLQSSLNPSEIPEDI